MERLRVQVECEGIVQGVGFRPFVHKLALEHGLAGWVLNSTSGVVIQLEGKPDSVRAYLTRLRTAAPPLSRILSLRTRELPPLGMDGFTIKPSQRNEDELTLLCPDVALCADCRRELLDPADRRYRYPFINCTNCGPRYTIVRALPYDRPATTMAGFPLCPGCAREYADKTDRRYHAQPVACPACGPRAWCEPGAGEDSYGAICSAARLLLDGGIAAIKGLGGFHLACLAASDEAVLRLRQRKQRSFFKPLAVMALSLATAHELCELTQADIDWLESYQSPILLAPKHAGVEGRILSPYVAPRLDRLGIMLPYTPLHVLLLQEVDASLVMTSANLSDEPLVADNDEARRKLAGLADILLLHDRPIHARCDDSVLASSASTPVMLRHSRGFSPFPICLGQDGPDVLALGGDLKTTFAASRGRFAFLSPHLGDGENLETYAFFRETWEHYRRLFGLKPQAIACDLHPGYHTGTWAAELAAELDVPLLRVQHHHAHLAALLTEFNLSGPRTAIVADGTGYGADGTIWGGEILSGDCTSCERLAHLRPIPLLGGDNAVREPWRIALALLLETDASLAERYTSHLQLGKLGQDVVSEFPSRIPENANAAYTAPQTDAVLQVAALLRSSTGTVLSSALGRLFDGVAALLGVTMHSTYEGQAPMELEAIARQAAIGTSFPVELEPIDTEFLDWRPIVAWLATTSQPTAMRAAVFHHWIARALMRATLGSPSGIPQGELLATGGCLQNTMLRELLEELCAQHGLHLITHKEIPAGDGGLALGTLAVARQKLASRQSS